MKGSFGACGISSRRLGGVVAGKVRPSAEIIAE